MLNRRARLLVLLLPCVCAALIAVPTAAQSGPQPASDSSIVYLPAILGTPSIEQQVVDLTNQERARVGCQPLTISPQLSAAAEGHSKDMALNNFFSHNGSNGSTPWERMQEAGYRYSAAAENIAAAQPTAALVVTAWMNSKVHRDNILNCQLREIGIGYYDQSDDQSDVHLDDGSMSGPFHYYWTQDFGTP
jgi:uncharacterized protein YkwD